MNIIKYRFFNYEKAVEQGRKRYLAGEIIKRRSWPHTHLEIELDEEYKHLSFSATVEDAFKGCRLKLIKYTNPWWDTIVKEVSSEDMSMIWDRINSINGKKYDLWGIGMFGTRWKIIVPTRDRYWCNKAVAYVTPMVYAGDINVTPETMYRNMKQEHVN